MARRPPTPRLVPAAPCPCGLGPAYPACCGRWHRGAEPPSAELLMRSRYAAFAVGDVPHLLRTWAAATRPAALRLDRGLRWTGLDVVATVRGGLLDDAGEVAFAAHYVERGEQRILHEHSLFRREDGGWRYVGPVPDA